MNSGAPVMTRGNQLLCLFLVSHFRREKGGASYGVREGATVMAFTMSSCYGDCYSGRRIASSYVPLPNRVVYQPVYCGCTVYCSVGKGAQCRIASNCPCSAITHWRYPNFRTITDLQATAHSGLNVGLRLSKVELNMGQCNQKLLPETQHLIYGVHCLL